jgi:adenylate cyclase class 2
MLEIEMKFPVPDHEATRRRLVELGAVEQPALEQVDAYFNHPIRDFAQTSEALRIRTSNGRVMLTYKGPQLDPLIKVRHEIETQIEPGSLAGFRETLVLLGFRPVCDVVKRRIPWRLRHTGREFEVALDDVDQLGAFVEVETLAPESERASARDALLAVAEALTLSGQIRKSYLRMLLDKANGAGTGE